MKQSTVLIALFLMITAVGYSQVKSSKKIKPRLEDQVEQYFFVLLKTGPKQDVDSAQKAILFKGHMDNINKLYNDGILKVAGPFGKNDFAWRGIFIFDCKTKEEAEKIALSDPAVAAGLFIVDIAPWYSSPTGSFTHGKPKKH